MFIAQLLEGPSKQLKRVFQIEHNIVKNPNLPESNQLAIYNRGREFEGSIASPTRSRCLVVSLWYRASTVLLLYGKTDRKNMKTAVYDNDYAQKRNENFKVLSFLEAAERKSSRTKLAMNDFI